MRYEGFIEEIQKIIDKDLSFLDYLEIKKEPNIIHYFLAKHVLNHDDVITTNFDYLIERALMNSLPSNKINLINPIITKDQYLKLNKVESIYNDKQFFLFKVHGSKKNIISNQGTSESLITTLSSLGKDREEGDTFTIEPYKKPIISRILKDRVLVVLGYSGSDDFDIAPFLMEIPSYKKIVWIEHDPQKTSPELTEIFQVEVEQKDSKISSQSKQERFLIELKKKHGIEIYMIKTHTAHFVSEQLWSHIFDPASKPMIKNNVPKDDILFNEWITSLKNYTNIDEITKYKFAGYVYNGLSEWNDSIRVWQKGLDLAKLEKNEKEEAELMTDIAGIHIEDIKNEKAMELLLSAYKLYDRLGDDKGKSTCLNNIGLIYSKKADYTNAIKNYEKSLELSNKQNDLERMSAPLMNLGVLYSRMGDNDKAIEYYQKLMSIVKQTGKLNYKAEALMNIGTIKYYLAEYKNAPKLFEEALQIDRLIGSLPEQAVRLNYIGLTFQQLDDPDRAYEHFLEGLQIARDIGDLESQASLLHMIGNFHNAQDDDENALKSWEDALQICNDYKILPRKSTLQNTFGSFYYNKEMYEEALKYFSLSLKTAQEIGDKSYIAEILKSIAVVSFSMKDYETACNKYREIIKITDELGDLEKKATYLRDLSTVYHKMTNNIEDSIKMLQKSKDLYEKIGNTQLANKVDKDIEYLRNQI